MTAGSKSVPVIVLLLYFLFPLLVQLVPISPGSHAPISAGSHASISPGSHTFISQAPTSFREMAERAKTLVEKILRDLPSVHASTVNTQGLTFDPSSQTTHLQMMVMSLGIPAAPVLKPLSPRFTLDVCVSRMSAGGLLYQRLLGVLADRVDGLMDLWSDLRDLVTHINKMREAAQLDVDSQDQNQSLDLASRLHGNYEVQVTLHVTLAQLRSFCHDLIRSLRAIATYGPRTVGTR